MMSAAKTAIVPMQDLLSLGAGHRMNTPGTVEGNWSWRFEWEQMPEGLAERLREITTRYGRVSDGVSIEGFQQEKGEATVERRSA